MEVTKGRTGLARARSSASSNSRTGNKDTVELESNQVSEAEMTGQPQKVKGKGKGKVLEPQQQAGTAAAMTLSEWIRKYGECITRQVVSPTCAGFSATRVEVAPGRVARTHISSLMIITGLLSENSHPSCRAKYWLIAPQHERLRSPRLSVRSGGSLGKLKQRCSLHSRVSGRSCYRRSL